MYRTAASRARSLKGRVGSTRSAVTAAATGSWLTGADSSALPSLETPLAGVNVPPPLPDYVEPSKTKITKLSNGVRIASETSPSPAASVGLYINSGSIYETPISSGASHLLQRLAFKSTTNRSHLRIVSEVEAIGGHISASATRDHMEYTFHALKTYVPQMVELLVDSVRNHAFLKWEINEELKKMEEENAELSMNPRALLLEKIHSAGFSGALGNPLFPSNEALNSLSSNILQQFVLENYTAPRIVVAASGVDHEELLSIAEPLLSDLPSVPPVVDPKSQYVGGEYRTYCDTMVYITDPQELDGAHVALAFEVPGGWLQEKQAIVLTVLQLLMGGGGSFSAGGPGKGMHSRLNVRVLNHYQEFRNITAFNSLFNDSGLFGIYASTGYEFASQAVPIAANELLAVATPGQVREVELERAKESMKAAVLMNLESRMIALEDIGRQVLTYGERKPVEDLLKMVEGVTLKDVTTAAQQIISSPLTMASYGNVGKVPKYRLVNRMFHPE